MAEVFDLIVIGSGAAAAAPAQRCRSAGWRVAVIDELPLGGTCALRGCDPKKVLVGAAELVDAARRLRGHGVSGPLQLDWPELIRFKRSFTDPVPAERAEAYRRAGIETIRGRARFIDREHLVVNERVLEARTFVVAAGAKPRSLGIAGESCVATSTEFLELTRMPRRAVFIGAGYISFELAHVLNRAGAAATVVGRGAPLAQFDRDLVARLVEHSRALGIEIQLDSAVTAVGRSGEDYTIALRARGDTTTLRADLVVHGGGRVPNTDGLDLAAAGVATDEHGGVRANDYLQSETNPRIYAAGDAVARTPGKRPLTPVAAYEGALVASNLLDGHRRRRVYRAIPSVVFTVPPLALVGETEAEAERAGLDVEVHSADTSAWYTNRRLGETAAMYKVLVDKKTGRLVGAHLFGPGAEEIINLFALAMRHEIPAAELKHMQYAYPSAASDLPYML